SQDAKLQAISQWFKQLRLMSETESIETMLEHLIGAHTPLLPIDEDGDDQDWLSAQADSNDAQPPGYTSPFKEHYFATSNTSADQGRYIGFLSSLQVFMQKLRAYRPGQQLKLADL